MNCPGCGKEVKKDALKCEPCGVSIGPLIEGQSNEFFKDPVWGHLAASEKNIWFMHGSEYQNKITLGRNEIQKMSQEGKKIKISAISPKYGAYAAVFAAIDGGDISPDVIMMLRRFRYL